MGRNATAQETDCFQSRMKGKAARVLALEACVLETQQEVDQAARRQVRHKQAFLSWNLMKTWRTGFDFVKASDTRNRPSDQQLPVRSYSLVDNEIWHRDQMKRWFDMYSSPQAPEEVDLLASGYNLSIDKNDVLPPLRRTDRVAIPSWAVAEDKKVLAASQRKRDDAMSLRNLPERHFSDIEGNIQIEIARSAVLASRLKPPKGWGAQHTHVSGFLSPPWRERPPQEAPRYQPPHVIRARDDFMQAGGGLETYLVTRAATKQRAVAMQAGAGIGGVCRGQTSTGLRS